MNNIVDSLLDNHHIRTVCGDFVVEAVGALQTVGFVGDTVVFPQNPGTGGGAADDCGAVIAFVKTPKRQFVRPVLSGNGVTIADDGPIACVGQDGNVA